MGLESSQIYGLIAFLIGFVPVLWFAFWLIKSTDKDLEELKRYKQEKRELN
jgi:hypothetical protein